MGCCSLFQRIFPTQGSNPGLLHCRQTLYRLRHQGSHNSLVTHSKHAPSLTAYTQYTHIAHINFLNIAHNNPRPPPTHTLSIPHPHSLPGTLPGAPTRGQTCPVPKRPGTACLSVLCPHSPHLDRAAPVPRDRGRRSLRYRLSEATS